MACYVSKPNLDDCEMHQLKSLKHLSLSFSVPLFLEHKCIVQLPHTYLKYSEAQWLCAADNYLKLYTTEQTLSICCG